MDQDHFTDNPLIQSMGNALGLGSLFIEGGPAAAGAAGPPPQALAAATAPPPKIAADRALVPEQRVAQTRESMAVRERYPQAKPASTRGSSPGANPGMNLPGVMSADVLMHPEVQKLLGQYGITPEQIQGTVQNASPNLFMNNPNFNSQHPALSRGIEGALEGAAFTKGSNTWGEGISNVAQGLLAAKGARAEKYNNQLMMPFEQAQQVAGLQNVSVEQKLKQAQAAYDQSHASYWDALPDLRAKAEQDKMETANRVDNLKAQLAVNQYTNAHKDFALLPQEQAKLDTANEQYKGEIPAAVLQGIYNPAIQRYEDKRAQDQLERANVQGGYHLRAAGMTADHAAARLANTDATKELGTLRANYAAFLKSRDVYGDGYDVNGNLVTGADAQRAANEYIARINEATGRLKQIPEDMKTPGSGMVTPKTPATKPHLKYNPDGTIG